MSKQNLVSFMRELRKILPSTAKKVKGEVSKYNVDDIVTIECTYYCRYGESKEEKVKECLPYTVKLSINARTYSNTVYEKLGLTAASYIGYRHAIRPKTYQKRKDGSFNLEAISAGVTKMLKEFDESIDAQVARVKEDNRKQKETKARKAAGDKVFKKHFGENFARFSSADWKPSDNIDRHYIGKSIKVFITLNSDEQLEDLDKLLAFIKKNDMLQPFKDE